MSLQYAAYGLAATLAAAVILIGGLYIVTPWAATASFGLVRPAETAPPFGGFVSRVFATSSRTRRPRPHGLGKLRVVGIVLLMEALIPLGDMTLILAARGSATCVRDPRPHRPAHAGRGHPARERCRLIAASDVATRPSVCSAFP